MADDDRCNHVITDDLPGTDRFHRDVFKIEPVHSDDDSVVLRFARRSSIVAKRSRAQLVDPAPVVGADAGVRSVLTVHVEDVDTWCATLKERGVGLLERTDGPPWGPRTASFRDPSGQVWEIAS